MVTGSGDQLVGDRTQSPKARDAPSESPCAGPAERMLPGRQGAQEPRSAVGMRRPPTPGFRPVPRRSAQRARAAIRGDTQTEAVKATSWIAVGPRRTARTSRDRRTRFSVRLCGERHLMAQEKKRSVTELAQSCEPDVATHVTCGVSPPITAFYTGPEAGGSLEAT